MLKNKHEFNQLNWNKVNGLIPVIVQDYTSNIILMHGYMNEQAFLQTLKDQQVVFYSRTKKRLWKKGETSGNYLKVVDITSDCDRDTLLVFATPIGDTCHLKKMSCFNLTPKQSVLYLDKLDKIIENKKHLPQSNSYTSKLYQLGTSRISQKVGEEAIETILSAMKKDKEELINEASDLIYHLMVLLHDQNLNLNAVIKNLAMRNKIK